MTISKSHKYYFDKVSIDKRNSKKIAYQIQIYNNNIVDDYVSNFNQGNDEKPKESMLMADLAILNKPSVYKNYQKIIDHPYVDETAINRIIIKNIANKNLEKIVEVETERISKNIDFVNQFLKNNPVPQKMYEDILNQQKEKSIANRYEILKEVAIKANELSSSHGLNIPPNVFTYRNLDMTARSMYRESQMTSGHEKILAINRSLEENGKDKKYTMKKWVWTGNGKTTRHESMNGIDPIPIEMPFTVINDKTLETDEMMYPMDPNGSFGNAYCCWCEIEYF